MSITMFVVGLWFWSMGFIMPDYRPSLIIGAAICIAASGVAFSIEELTDVIRKELE